MTSSTRTRRASTAAAPPAASRGSPIQRATSCPCTARCELCAELSSCALRRSKHLKLDQVWYIALPRHSRARVRRRAKGPPCGARLHPSQEGTPQQRRRRQEDGRPLDPQAGLGEEAARQGQNRLAG